MSDTNQPIDTGPRDVDSLAGDSLDARIAADVSRALPEGGTPPTSTPPPQPGAGQGQPQQPQAGDQTSKLMEMIQAQQAQIQQLIQAQTQPPAPVQPPEPDKPWDPFAGPDMQSLGLPEGTKALWQRVQEIPAIENALNGLGDDQPERRQALQSRLERAQESKVLLHTMASQHRAMQELRNELGQLRQGAQGNPKLKEVMSSVDRMLGGVYSDGEKERWGGLVEALGEHASEAAAVLRDALGDAITADMEWQDVGRHTASALDRLSDLVDLYRLSGEDGRKRLEQRNADNHRVIGLLRKVGAASPAQQQATQATQTQPSNGYATPPLSPAQPYTHATAPLDDKVTEWMVNASGSDIDAALQQQVNRRLAQRNGT